MPSSGPDAVVYQASVDDRTGEFFDKFEARINQMAGRTEQSFKGVEQSIGAVGKVAGLVGGIVGSVATMALDKVISMAGQAKAFLTESTQLAGRAQELGVVLDVVGKNAGYSKDQMAEFESGLQETGISIIESRDSLAKMVQAELDLNTSTKLATVAQNAATIAGTNSSDAFQRILWGITTLQPEILKNMGLTINLQQETKKWADANNRAVESLTAVERKTIAVNAVFKAGIKIEGAYEAAMGTPFKKLGSQVRYMQDFMVKLGETFLEGWGEQIDYVNDKLREAKGWLEDNKDVVEQLGRSFAIAMQIALDGINLTIEAIGTLTKGVGSAIVDVGMLISIIFGGLDKVEAKSARSKLGQHFAEIVSIVVASVSTGVMLIVELIKQATEDIGILWDFVMGKITPDEFRKRLHEWRTSMLSNIKDTVINTFEGTYTTMAEFTGLLKDMEDVGDDAASGINKTVDALLKLRDALLQATGSMEDLYNKMKSDEAIKAIKDLRAAIEAELKASWAREDAARKHADSVKKIMEGARDSDKQAAEDHSKALIDIEKEYQRQLRDMKQRFEFDASEFARSRDAIGLLRLMRQHNFELQQAKQNKDDQIEDANATWQEQRQNIDKQRQEALQDLQEAEQEQLEEQERQADRERQLQALKDQWAQEDRDKEYAKQLADIIKNYNAMDGATETGLNAMLDRWRVYFGDLITMAQEQMAAVETTVDPFGLAGQTGTGTTNPAGPAQYQSNMYPNMPGVIGQAGIVSQLLAGSGSVLSPTGYSVPPIPSVNPNGRSGTQRQELKVQVEGYALDPYMQRVLTNALIEVERNRSG